MLKPIDKISLDDLVGIWRNPRDGKPYYDFTIIPISDINYRYEFYDYYTETRYVGNIIDFVFLPDSRTIKLILENCFDIELYQILDDDICLHFDRKLVFNKIS